MDTVTDTQGEHHVKTERHTDAGVRQPCEDRDSDWRYAAQAKECLGPPKAERGKGGPSSGGFGRIIIPLTP